MPTDPLQSVLRHNLTSHLVLTKRKGVMNNKITKNSDENKTATV